MRVPLPLRDEGCDWMTQIPGIVSWCKVRCDWSRCYLALNARVGAVCWWWNRHVELRFYQHFWHLLLSCQNLPQITRAALFWRHDYQRWGFLDFTSLNLGQYTLHITTKSSEYLWNISDHKLSTSQNVISTKREYIPWTPSCSWYGLFLSSTIAGGPVATGEW